MHAHANVYTNAYIQTHSRAHIKLHYAAVRLHLRNTGRRYWPRDLCFSGMFPALRLATQPGYFPADFP